LSAGPKTKAVKDRIRATHSKNDDETLEAKANNMQLCRIRYEENIEQKLDIIFQNIGVNLLPKNTV